MPALGFLALHHTDSCPGDSFATPAGTAHTSRTDGLRICRLKFAVTRRIAGWAFVFLRHERSNQHTINGQWMSGQTQILHNPEAEFAAPHKQGKQLTRRAVRRKLDLHEASSLHQSRQNTVKIKLHSTKPTSSLGRRLWHNVVPSQGGTYYNTVRKVPRSCHTWIPIYFFL